jgi:Domain of unknown function (DUF4440)
MKRFTIVAATTIILTAAVAQDRSGVPRPPSTPTLPPGPQTAPAPVPPADLAGPGQPPLAAAPIAPPSPTSLPPGLQAPWANDPNVQQVLALRQLGIAAMTAGTMSAESERYSTTFVANTPGNGVVPGSTLLDMFARGAIRYERVEQSIEYAASHGPDLVVIMGEELVVPGAGLANAGRRVHRRFTDVFRRENGEWRHDLRHANVISIEGDGEDLQNEGDDASAAAALGAQTVGSN